MARRRAHRPQRRRIFVGCEGASEVGYVALIRLLAEEAGHFVHLDIHDCCGGDPLAIVETAVRVHDSRKARNGAYAARSIFLDADRRGNHPERSARAIQLARDNGFHAIWSKPVLEALLLRHFPRFERQQPATPDLALEALHGCWPEYRKGMAAKELREWLDCAAVARAADLEPELRKFLESIDPGLPRALRQQG